MAEKEVTTPQEITAPVVKKKKNKRAVPQGQVHIKSTFNNTIITFTDPDGGTLASASAGACGFRGSKKSTAFAAQIAMEKAAGIVKQNFSLSKVDVFLKGLGLGREAAVRSLQTSDIYVNSISDVTGLPHGGCRPRKARRI
ncbi:MAG TPA: 30S ribosomal protein S11 [Candidatus Saccharimonadales bacterium]